MRTSNVVMVLAVGTDLIRGVFFAMGLNLLGARRSASGALLPALYGLGTAAFIAVAGASGRVVQKILDGPATPRGPKLLRQASGVAILLGGLPFLSAAP